jgi:hypothetical protein
MQTSCHLKDTDEVCVRYSFRYTVCITLNKTFDKMSVDKRILSITQTGYVWLVVGIKMRLNVCRQKKWNDCIAIIYCYIKIV